MSTHMASINIAIKEDAYAFLKSLKGRDRSFSDVILELKEKYRSGATGKELLKFAGALKNKKIDWKEKERRMKEFRESFNKRMNETRELMERKR